MNTATLAKMIGGLALAGSCAAPSAAAAATAPNPADSKQTVIKSGIPIVGTPGGLTKAAPPALPAIQTTVSPKSPSPTPAPDKPKNQNENKPAAVATPAAPAAHGFTPLRITTPALTAVGTGAALTPPGSFAKRIRTPEIVAVGTGAALGAPAFPPRTIRTGPINAQATGRLP